jgi:hypothetical protein
VAVGEGVGALNRPGPAGGGCPDGGAADHSRQRGELAAAREVNTPPPARARGRRTPGQSAPCRYGATTSLVSLLPTTPNDLNIESEASPAQHPLLEQANIVAPHKLEAPTEVWLDPAIEVLQIVWKGTAAVLAF